MTDFKLWISPAGEVVAPPVHPMTTVDVIYSDGGKGTYIHARNLNWSSAGDGPNIIAYSVVEEYKPERSPCPFCGAPDIACVPAEDDPDYEADYDVVAQCMSCGARGPNGEHKAGDAAVAAWNRREVLPEPPLDLTKITTPFGLLDEATQAALKAHGGPYEWWDVDCDFVAVDQPVWAARIVYRVAPSAAPAKPAPDRTVDQIIADTGSEIDAIFAKAKPAPREVVAWAVVRGDGIAEVCFDEVDAVREARKGGTVRPLGYLP